MMYTTEPNESAIVFREVKALYETSATTMGQWMWRHHIPWVARKAALLAKKYGAHQENAICAALLHDLGDATYERDDPQFESWSWEQAKAILKKAGYRHAQREAILEAIRTHSCHPGHLPTTLEGKVLATADAMWHLQTNFFAEICYMNRPIAGAYADWQTWFNKKIDRDFNVKILFDDEREEVRADHDALIKVFAKQ